VVPHTGERGERVGGDGVEIDRVVAETLRERATRLEVVLALRQGRGARGTRP
jgi:hypothetical protein